MITALQIRAARSILNWGQAELAERAGLTQSTIANLELEKHFPSKTTSQALIKAFEGAGIELLPDGVRRLRGIVEFSGDDAVLSLFDHIFYTLRNSPESEVLISGADEQKSPSNLYPKITRVRDLGVKFRILIEEGNSHLLGPVEEYRFIPKRHFSNTPVFVYGDKVAIFIPRPNKPLIQVISNSALAESQQKLFDFIWECSSPAKKSSATQLYFGKSNPERTNTGNT